MKKLLLLLFVAGFSMQGFSQKDEDAPRGFQKDKLFTGGDLALALYTGGTTLGASPYFGYSLTRWLDAALSFNFVYQGQRDIYSNKLRQFNYGPGVFVRIFPVQNIYIHAQLEHNFISLKEIYNAGPTYKSKFDANSVLLGGGYTTGREESNTYFYFSVLFDVAQQPNSPYIDFAGRIIPIVKTGINIKLFQGGGGRGRVK